MIRNLWGWYRDYIYIAYWQLHGFFFRIDPKKFLDPADPHLAPVVLIPGIYENWQFMKPIAAALYDSGHPVYVVKKVGYNTASIPIMAHTIAEYIAEQDLNDAVIVAHSKGGLIAKYVMAKTESKTRISHIIAINTPFSGSRYARLFLIPSIRSFSPKHAVIRMLHKDQQINSSITSLYSCFDPHIPGGSYLKGAHNIELETIGHFRPIGDAKTIEVIKRVINDNFLTETMK